VFLSGCFLSHKEDRAYSQHENNFEDVTNYVTICSMKFAVPVSLVTPSQLTSTTMSTTTSLASVTEQSTELAPYERGCEIDGKFYSDGAQIIGDPSKPCELCYCIRNKTACVMQECILHVEGCDPVFQPGVCCPVRYQCDYPPQITDQSTVAGLITTTLSSIFSPAPLSGSCTMGGKTYADGSQIPGAGPDPSPCEHCYCMRGEVNFLLLLLIFHLITQDSRRPCF